MQPRQHATAAASHERAFPVLTLSCCVALLLGVLTPVVFEYGLPPAARNLHPQLLRTAWAVLAATPLAAWAEWRWLAPRRSAWEASGPTPYRFGLRALLLAMTLCGASLAVASRWPAAPPLAAAALALVGAGRQGLRLLRRVGALLAVLFLPFAWVVAVSVPWGHVSGLLEHLPAAPHALTAELLRAAGLGLSRDAVEAVASLAVVVHIALGAYLMSRDAGAWPAFLVASLLYSSLTSLAVHAAFRA